MKIGTSLALIAVGLILSYAVDFQLPGIAVGTLGAILFFVGLLGLVVSVGLEVAATRAPRPPRAREPRRERAPEPVRRAQTPYDPIQPLPPRPSPSSRDRTRAIRDPSDDETRPLG